MSDLGFRSPAVPYRLSRRRVALPLVALLLLLGSLTAIVAPAAGETVGPFVTTDWTDYHPGDTVVITGGGFDPGETVRLELIRDGEEEAWYDAYADELGNFVSTGYSPGPEDLGSSYVLNATGLSSRRTATARFTDGTMSYSPPQRIFELQGGDAVSSQINVRAPQDLAVPSTLTLGIVHGGGLPAGLDLPAGWVTISPATQVYTRSGPSGEKRWDFSVEAPPGAAPGRYRAFLRVTAGLGGSVTAGEGCLLQVDVTAPTPTDTQAPVSSASAGTLPGGTPYLSSTWTNGDVEVALSATDLPAGGSGVQQIRYSIDGGIGYEVYTGPFTVAAEGITTILYLATDNQGNTEAANAFVVKIDRTAPSIVAQRETPANAHGWNDGDVNASYAASDALSGLASPAEGTHTFSSEGQDQSHTFTVFDVAGNSATATVDDVSIDRTPPVISAQRDTPAAGAWDRTPVVASYTASDALSGLADAATGTLTFEADGADQSHTFTVRDKAGNEATATVGDIDIDRTPPAIHVDRIPSGSGWTNGAVVASYSASDALSGLASPAEGTHTFTAEGADQSHTFTVSDVAGNTASATVSGVNIDGTPPVISAQRVTPANANGWNNGPVALAYTASDALSGLVEPATGGHSLTAEGAGQSYTFTVHDLAGNSASATVGGVNIDLTAPSLTLPGALAAIATTAAGAPVSYAVAASDDLTAAALLVIASTPADGAVFPLGPTTVNASATDLAGNVARGSFVVTVTYSWSGILQPINADGSSVFKLGSTVPVKFQLAGGSAGIANAVASLSYRKISSGVVGDELEAVSTAAATSGNLFRYDATSAQYVFNWSTKGLSQGTYQLTINLGDRVPRTVLVSLR